MAQQTRATQSTPSALVYDTLSPLPFDAVTPAGALTNATVSGRIALPFACKIYAVTIVQATGANFVTSFNVIQFNAADATPNNPIGTNDNTEGGTVPPTLAANGVALFAADQAVVLAADVAQSFFNANFDVIYGQNSLLTLRLVTAGAGGACKVSLAIKPYKLIPSKPTIVQFTPSIDFAQ